jgi:TonB family protein
MRTTKTLPVLITVLLLHPVSFAQPAFSAQQQPTATSQSGSKQLSPEQVADLAEAKRLSAEVVRLYNEKKYDDALPLAKRALEIRERVSGPAAEIVALALTNLAELYIAKHKYSDALATYQRVLPIYEKLFGPVSERTATTIESLALLRFIKGDFSEAELFHKRAVAIRESVFGPERPEVAIALYQLAEFYRSRADYKSAEPLFLRAIAINDKTLPKDDHGRGNVIQRYICFLYESRELSEAKKLEHEFYESRRDKTRPDHVSPESGGVLNGKAISLPKPSFPPEARQLRASGIVRVQVTIDETGKVIDAKVLCGHPVFAKPSEEAARKARFTATKLSGQPVKVTGIILYSFIAM